MQGVTMLKNTGAMTEAAYYGSYAREPVGVRRRARREFWRAFRREAVMVIADQLDNGEVEPVANVFTAMAQADAQQAEAWEVEADIEARLTKLHARRAALYDELYEANEAIERLSDRLYCVRHGVCSCYMRCLD